MIDLNFVTDNCPEGWMLNPKEKVVSGIIRGLNRCDGECPCCNDSEDTRCPCSNFRTKQKCCCGLYVKKE